MTEFDKGYIPHVPRDLVASTYSDDDYLTALYLERAFLRDQVQIEIPDSTLTLPSDEALASDTRYTVVRTYLEQTGGDAHVPRHLVLANDYPRMGREYANGFVHRRVRAYQEFGANVDVVSFKRGQKPEVYDFDGIRVLAGYGYELLGMLAARKYRSVSAHFLNPGMWNTLYPARHELPLTVFLHGYEVDRWIRRKFDLRTPEDINAAISRTMQLQAFWRKVINDGELIPHFVCVSDWWRRVVAEDMEVEIPEGRTSVIHNVTDTDLFQYVPKDADQRFHVLCVRSFDSLKYSPDVVIDTLEKLRESSVWSKLHFKIIGDGRYFSILERALANYSNVSLERRFLTQAQIAALHRTHGLFLVPTRYDSQGVSRDEAMSSGLVPITNAVAAVPEFADNDSAILAPPDDAAAMARGIEELASDPGRFLRMSAAAAARVRAQSGPDSTVRREAELLGML